MKIKLEEIIIYNSAWESRNVLFEDGLNVITGYSKTGKSALLEIINYCFFSRLSNIPVWVVKDFAYMYVLILNIENTYLVIWREEQEPNKCYIFDIENHTNIKFEDFNSSTAINVANARDLILKKFGVKIDEKYWTTNKWAVSIRSMLPLLLQPQHLIANKYALFMWFDDYFRKMSIIDEFPLFIKIADNNYLKIKRRLDELKKDIRKEDNEVFVKEKQYSKLKNQIEHEIIDFLLTLWVNKEKIPNTQDGLLRLNLDNIFNTRFSDNIYNNSLSKESLIPTRKKRDLLNKKLQEINNQLKSIDFTDDEINKYFNWLSTLKWLVDDELAHIPKELHCPLCASNVDKHLNEFDEFKENFNFFNNESKILKSYEGSIEDKKYKLLNEKKKVKEEIQSVNNYLRSLENIDNKDYTIFEKLLTLKTKISAQKEYLSELTSLNRESIKDESNIEILELEQKLKRFDIEETKTRLNEYLNQKINSICIRLDVEDKFMQSNLKFDFSTFTLFYNDWSDKIGLSEIWSWANILAWHISLFLWILWLSLKTDSNLPKFLIIDQPTQVYFPEKNPNFDKDNDFFIGNSIDKDFQNVEKLYLVILEELEKMKSEFLYEPQVIIMDHANNLNLWEKYEFNKYVRKNWRNWSALI